MDYSGFIAVLMFIAVVQLSNKFHIRPIISSLLAVIPPLMFTLMLRHYTSVNQEFRIDSLLSWTSIVILVLQVGVGVLTFQKLQEYEDTYVAWFAWAAGGGCLMLFIIPWVMQNIVRI